MADDNAPLLEPLPPFSECRDSFAHMAASRRASGAAVVQSVWVLVLRATPTRRTDLTLSERFDQWAIRHYCEGVRHIELAFRFTDGSVLAFTVDRAEPTRHADSGRVRCLAVDMRTAYRTPFWIHHRLASLSDEEQHGLLEFCMRQQGKPFNKHMYYNFVPLIGDLLLRAHERPTEEQAYFCSQLVACALRWIRPVQFAAVYPRRCTPARAYALLQSDTSFFVADFLTPVDTMAI